MNLATLCALGNSKDEVSLFSVTRSTLGEAGAVVFSIAYVFMHECLIIACCLKGADFALGREVRHEVDLTKAC